MSRNAFSIILLVAALAAVYAYKKPSLIPNSETPPLAQSFDSNSKTQATVESSKTPQSHLSPKDTLVTNETLLMEGDVELPENRIAFQQIYEVSGARHSLQTKQTLWEVPPDNPLVKTHLGERHMVADQLMVRLHSPQDSDRFESRLKSLGYSIRKQTPSGLYVIGFEIDTLDSLQRVEKEFKEWPEVKTVLPDYMGKISP